MKKCDVCIIGAGAGGIGCAYRLIKNGISVIVADKNPDFGGTAVYSGVDGWEPGVSLDGIHTLLYEKMKNRGGCHVVETVPNCNIFEKDNGLNWVNHSFEKYPWGLSVKSGADYGETMKRCTFLREDASMRRLQFEPSAMTAAVNEIFADYEENLEKMFGTMFVSADTENGKIKSVTVSKNGEKEEIFADVFVDASGDIVLARAAGCETAFGSESSDVYSEPSAEGGSDTVNAVSYVFRVAKAENSLDEIPQKYEKYDIGKWKSEEMRRVVSCFTEYPNGDININMLPTMQGNTYFELGENADSVGRARVWAYWHYLQTEKGMQGYTLKHIYDAGVRESHRLVGKYVLTENDVRAGILRQPKIGRTVAIADHALDIHGKNGMCRELEYPYEIPIECTMTKEFENLFVACRGASFSHIAAASARLTRTMLSLGEGVGEYISELLKEETGYSGVKF